MSDDATPNCRKDPRADIVLKVEYPDVEGFLQDYTVNISRGGTMIRVNRPLAISDRVELILSFPGLLAPINLSGIVRWVQQEEECEITAGVEFDEQQPIIWAALETLVERISTGDRRVMSPVVRILVVEDNIHVARLISDGIATFIKRSQLLLMFETRHASHGKEALTMMKEEPFDVLMVDMYLPVMDGESLILELRQSPKWDHLPIIALSAGGMDARDRALNAGADFFLDKPLRLCDVLETMSKLMVSLKEKQPATR